MDFQLDIGQLGHVLENIEKEFGMKVLVKMKLSGGWFTAGGEAHVEKVPAYKKEGCHGKDNIIHIRINNDENDKGTIIKLTGTGTKFNINVSDSKYKEIKTNNGLNLDTIKTNKDECKLRIDENIIFSISRNMNDIANIVKKIE